MPCFYLTPKQDDFNKIPELQVCIAETLYDVDSIVADPGAYSSCLRYGPLDLFIIPGSGHRAKL